MNFVFELNDELFDFYVDENVKNMFIGVECIKEWLSINERSWNMLRNDEWSLNEDLLRWKIDYAVSFYSWGFDHMSLK